MSTPAQFKQQVKKFAEITVPKLVADIAVEMAVVTRRNVAENTPKLTGRAAGSWNASKNEPDYTTQPEYYMNPDGADDDGRVNLQGYALGDIIYLSNGIDYIEELNNGSSTKAPAGFVEATVNDLPRSVPEVVSRLRRKYGV